MKKLFDNRGLEAFVEGAARAFFASAWADEQEARGRRFSPGADLMKVAPATPLSAYVAAGILVGRLEGVNGKSLYQLVGLAAKADRTTAAVSLYREFGSDVALEAMGHGVSWFDDHAKFKLVIPRVEYNLP